MQGCREGEDARTRIGPERAFDPSGEMREIAKAHRTRSARYQHRRAMLAKCACNSVDYESVLVGLLGRAL
jgi:hypothetical protein